LANEHRSVNAIMAFLEHRPIALLTARAQPASAQFPLPGEKPQHSEDEAVTSQVASSLSVQKRPEAAASLEENLPEQVAASNADQVSSSDTSADQPNL